MLPNPAISHDEDGLRAHRRFLEHWASEVSPAAAARAKEAFDAGRRALHGLLAITAVSVVLTLGVSSASGRVLAAVAQCLCFAGALVLATYWQVPFANRLTWSVML